MGLHIELLERSRRVVHGEIRETVLARQVAIHLLRRHRRHTGLRVLSSSVQMERTMQLACPPRMLPNSVTRWRLRGQMRGRPVAASAPSPRPASPQRRRLRPAGNVARPFGIGPGNRGCGFQLEPAFRSRLSNPTKTSTKSRATVGAWCAMLAELTIGEESPNSVL